MGARVINRSFSMPKPLDFSIANAFNTSEQRRRGQNKTRGCSLHVNSYEKVSEHLYMSDIRPRKKDIYEVTPTQSTMQELNEDK